uniref:SJCHGC08835 protein n=1 Tax=Schistosoma japonicum TaxID=6182 RepID=Q5DBW3_SCHJA|nr:SJCHGC08835 protein [Schistosoma japonicum]
MNLDVTSRLQEQSELIMVLKSRADFEMKRRKEAEYKLLEELSKSQDLQHQLLDCQRRMCDAEVNNRVLRSTINDLIRTLLFQRSMYQCKLKLRFIIMIILQWGLEWKKFLRHIY